MNTSLVDHGDRTPNSLGRPMLSICLFLSLCAGTVGCGYQLGGYKTPANVRLIAVPIFDNSTFPLRREVEYELTRAIRQEITARTTLTLVDQDRADLVIYGRIVEFRERVLAEGPLDEKEESTIRITVDLTVEDYRNRKTWKNRVRDSEPFSIARGESIDVARRRAIANLAEKILLAVEVW